MTFNIWRGGELVDFGKVAEAVKSANADLVGLQESEGNTRRLAEALGWQHVNERLKIISRFPLIDPPGGNGVYLWVQVAPGQMVAMGNLHLPSDPYGPYLVRDGSALEEVVANEQDTRMPMLQENLDVLPGVIAAGFPVLVTGDFNTPSHLDWTEAASKAIPAVKYPVQWPVTVAMEQAGFRDVYRVAHPDPVARPGITWTAGYPHPRLRPDETFDRIDLIFATKNVEVLNAEIVGEVGGKDVDIAIAPFPTDHRGVVATVRLTPVPPPPFVAAENRRVVRGEPIVVRYHAPGGEATDRLAIMPADGKLPDDVVMSIPPYEADFHGSVSFGSGLLARGEYAALLLNEAGAEVSRSQFWVVEPDAVPALRTSKASYSAGEPITLEWMNTPAFRWDWVGIYAAGDRDLYNYLGFLYTRATVDGTATFDADALGEAMLPAGEYEVRLMLDDGYVWLASTRFSVR
jgi:endonuclease/exonuclease/phosphatase family metal-dependent hydrolase